MTERPDAVPSDPDLEEVRLRLLLFARRRLPEEALDGRGAEDFVQEALARWLEGDRRRPEGMALLPWLLGVVQSLIAHARARPAASALPSDPSAGSDDDVLERAEALRRALLRVRGAVARDPDASALLDALVAHWPEQDLPEIARGLGWPLDRARNTWRRLLYAVRGRLGGTLP